MLGVGAERRDDHAGRGEQHSFHEVVLFAEHRRAVIQRPVLLLQAADLFLQLLHSRVGSEIDERGLGVDVEDGRGSRAVTRNLQRLVDEVGRQPFEHQRVFARREVHASCARDDGAVGIDGGSRNARINGRGAQEDRGGQQEQTQGFHGGREGRRVKR